MRPLPFRKMIIMLKERQQVKQHSQVFLQRGDILSFDGKINLLLGTFQDAANAVNSIKTYLEPTAYRHGMVSSHNELFKEKNRSIIEKQFAPAH